MCSGDSALQSNKVTSTLAVFTKDCMSDQSFGSSPQQLRDRVRLHSDDSGDCYPAPGMQEGLVMYAGAQRAIFQGRSQASRHG